MVFIGILDDLDSSVKTIKFSCKNWQILVFIEKSDDFCRKI